MRCWIARSSSKTRFRIQPWEEPFEGPWLTWEIRESEISQDDWNFLNEAFGPDIWVDLEQIHQEVWLAGRPVQIQGVPLGPQDLA